MSTPSHSLEDISAHFCAVCTAMLKDCSKWLPESTVETRSGDHHKSVADLLAAVKMGCGICTRIKARSDAFIFSSKDNCIFTFTISHHALRIMTNIKDDNYVFRVLQLSTEHLPDPSGGDLHLTGRTYQCKYTGDNPVLEQASEWLSRCSCDHRLCGLSADSGYYPPRVLLLKGDVVKLLDTESHKPTGRYATLVRMSSLLVSQAIQPCLRTILLADML